MVTDHAKNERQRIQAATCGVPEWSWHGSAFGHERYSIRTDSRQRCRWCPGRGMSKARATHAGMANGVTLASGCEWHVAQWVRDPHWQRRSDS